MKRLLSFSLAFLCLLAAPLSSFAQIEVDSDGNVGIGPSPSADDKLEVNTTGDPSSYVKTALRSIAEGTSSYINIGLYADANGGSEAYAARFGGQVDITGDLTVDGTFYNNSDRRLKKNIQGLDRAGGLAKLSQLNPVSFRYKGTSQLQTAGYGDMDLPNGKKFGFVAQEVEQMLPSLVAKRKHVPVEKARGGQRPDISTYKGVSYVELIPVLVQAVQEQQAQIKTLRKKIERLKRQR
jgi:hypothetical protein